jgi:hypothetical protein
LNGDGGITPYLDFAKADRPGFSAFDHGFTIGNLESRVNKL